MDPIQHLIPPHQQQVICGPVQNRQIVPRSPVDDGEWLLLGTDPVEEVGFARHMQQLHPIVRHAGGNPGTSRRWYFDMLFQLPFWVRPLSRYFACRDWPFPLFYQGLHVCNCSRMEWFHISRLYMRIDRRSRAFTLVELLVVIAI